MSEGVEMGGPGTYRIAELWRYPVKSMGGERLEAAELRGGGVVGDRRWALRSSDTGLIVSAKRPRRYGALLEWSAALDGQHCTVTSPGGTQYAVEDPALAGALTEALGEQVTVVEVTHGAEETYDSEWPEIPGTSLSEIEAEFPIAMMTEKVSFVDLAAIHIVLASSMDALAARVPPEVTVDVRRFRPNIVVEPTGPSGGADSFIDLEWKDVAARLGGEVELWVAEAAPRCVMTTVSQAGLGPAREVLRVLAGDARKDTDFGTFACFGTYAEVTTGGAVSVGDAFRLSGAGDAG